MSAGFIPTEPENSHSVHGKAVSRFVVGLETARAQESFARILTTGGDYKHRAVAQDIVLAIPASSISFKQDVPEFHTFVHELVDLGFMKHQWGSV